MCLGVSVRLGRQGGSYKHSGGAAGAKGMGQLVLPRANHLCRGESRTKQKLQMLPDSAAIPSSSPQLIFPRHLPWHHSLCRGGHRTSALEMVPARQRKHCPPFTVLQGGIARASAYQDL